MTGSPEWTLRRLEALPALREHGFDALGWLPRERYDALVPPAWRAAVLLPGARSAIVLGTGGRAFFRAFQAAPEAGGARDPIDAFAARVVAEAVAQLAQAGAAGRALHYHERRGGAFADFQALARAAGLGAPSRLGLLLHPRFGPWLAVRSLVLTDARVAGAPAAGPDFDPCRGCAAPCTAACPGAAPAPDGFGLDRCLETTRVTPACRTGCAARRACPVGAAERYAPDAEAAHRAAALAAAGIP